MLKKFIQDKTILTLLIASAVLGVFTMLYVVLKIDSSKTAQIVAYRPTLGISGAFVQGSKLDLYSFAFVSFLVTVGGGFMSYRFYQVKRNYAVAFSVLMLIFLVFNLVVARAVLAIR